MNVEASPDSWLPPAATIRIPEVVELKVAVWDLASRPPSPDGQPAPATTPTQPRVTWRHTFGAERRTATWRQLAQAGFEADVIALQGVSGMRAARRLFPVRRYRAIVSQQLLAPSAGIGAGSYGIPVFRDDAPATTAMVLRKRRGVRPAGFKHFLPRPTRPNASEAAAGTPPTVAILAVRLRAYHRSVWIASIDSGTCREEKAPPCAAWLDLRTRFIDWARRAVDEKSALLLAGRWPDFLISSMPDGWIRQHYPARATPCKPELSRGDAASPCVSRRRHQACRRAGTCTPSVPQPPDAPESQAGATGSKCASAYRLTIRTQLTRAAPR